MGAYSPRGRPTCRGTFEGGVFFLSEAPEKVPRDFFFALSFFFFKYFLLLCLFDMRLRGLHLEGLQLLSPEAGADVWRRRPSDSCRPWYGTPTSTTAFQQQQQFFII